MTHKNTLYYGDNLNVMRENLRDESIDLIYLDPPFNSKRDYNVLFKAPDGHATDAQLTAFEDSWHWGPQAEGEFAELMRQPNTRLAELMNALRGFLKENDMLAYLVMMANRLVEMHRVLKPTGSLYLHCDPTASHYVKIVLDSVFGKAEYLNEIIWSYDGPQSPSKTKFSRKHDVIFRYAKDIGNVLTNEQGLYSYITMTETQAKDAGYNLDKEGRWYYTTPKGDYTDTSIERLTAEGRVQITKNGKVRIKHFLEAKNGQVVRKKKISDVWTDIPSLGLLANSKEALGYPTQKPLALLERIIQASSKEGDIVLDPFCGCGTAVHAAQKLGRNWVGIDITHLAVSLIEKRIKDAFPDSQFEVIGTPQDFESARDLAERDKYQFQWWACSLVNAQPYGGKKKGADGGTDGLIFFADEPGKPAKKAIVSVKGGLNVQRNMIADLKNTVAREKAEIGLFVTLVEPTREMVKEAAAAGFYQSPLGGGQQVPRIQILTIQGLLDGRERPQILDMDFGAQNFKKARTEDNRKQTALDL